MDGRGRVFDNIFVERLWRTVKYEKVYLSDLQSVQDAYEELTAYFAFNASTVSSAQPDFVGEGVCSEWKSPVRSGRRPSACCVG